MGAIGTPETSPEEYLDVFFTRSRSGRQADRPFQHHAEFAANVAAFLGDPR
jgi:hypothetical protein